MKKNLNKQVYSSLLWSSGGTLIIFFSKIVVMMVLARLLTPNEFGLVGVATLVVDFGRKFTQIGLGPAIIQRKLLLPIHVSTGHIINIIINVIMFLLMFYLSPWIATFFNSIEIINIIRVLSLCFVIRSISIIPLALITRKIDFKINAKIDSISYVIGYGLFGVIAALLNFGLWSLVVAILAEAVLRTILILSYNKENIGYKFSFKALKELLSFGIGQSLYQLSNYISLQGDNFVVGKFLGTTSLGIYGRAYQLISMPSRLFERSIGNVLFPAFSTIQDDKMKLQNIYINGLKLAGTLIIPFGVLISFCASDLIKLLLGYQWLKATVPMKIFALVIFFRVVYTISNIILKSTGNVYTMAFLQVLYGITILLLSYAGSLFYEINGVAFGVALSIILHTFILNVALKIKLGFPLKSLFASIFPHFALGLLNYILFYLIQNHLFAEFVFHPLVSLTLYSILTLTLCITLIYIWPKMFLGIYSDKILSYIKIK